MRNKEGLRPSIEIPRPPPRRAFYLLGSPCLLQWREVAPFGPSDNGAIIRRGLEVTALAILRPAQDYATAVPSSLPSLR